MKKRIVHIVLALFFGLSVNAQILAPMGHGLPAAPQKITSFNGGIIVAYENQNQAIELQVWNGDFWYKIQNPSLPKLGSNGNGDYEIVDIVEHNNEIYLCAAYSTKNNPSATNSILKWNGGNWEDLTTTDIATSTSLDKLVIQDGTVQCVGKYVNANGNYNIATLDNGQFELAGNLITKNLSSDDFSSVAVAKDKVYATGAFTDPASGLNSLAVWDGKEWSLAEFPPFLGENITAGQYNGEIVVYGKSNFSNETVKISAGALWQDMSQGMDEFTVTDITHFAEVNGSLFAVGQFEEHISQAQFNILEYNGHKWTKTNLFLSDIQQLYSTEESVVVSGDFSDNARIKFIGEIFKNRAQVATRVYHDKNGNCYKDQDEEWFPNFPVSLDQSIDFLNTDQFGQLYLPVSKEAHSLNAAAVDYWQPTCPDVEIDVDEYKTYYGSILGVNQKVGVRDAAVHIGDNKSYNIGNENRKTAMICYENSGSEPINDAELILKHGTSISDLTTQFAYENYSNNKATWKVNLNANDQQCFYITYNVNNVENSTLDVVINLRSGETDADANNNSDATSYEEGEVLVNDKHCGNGKYIAKNEDLLQYKIGYSNQGSMPALDLKITDELDTDIYISHRGIHSYTSHDCEVLSQYELMDNGNYKTKLIWSFTDINLASHEIDPDLSSGFIDVNVNILPNMIEKGETVCNMAKIYFSYKKGTFDEPIFTQTVCSEVNETGASSGDNRIPSYVEGLNIGPNPVQDVLLFNNTTFNDFDVVLHNAIGQEISNFTINSNSETRFNVEEFEAGVYFIYANGIFVHKFIVH